jgi:hypothetical protein
MILPNNSREQHTKFMVKVVQAEDTNFTNCGQLTTREHVYHKNDQRGEFWQKNQVVQLAVLYAFVNLPGCTVAHTATLTASYRIRSDYKSWPAEWTACPPPNSVYPIGNVPKYINFSKTFMIKYYHIKRLMNGIWRTSHFWSKLHCILLTGK